tara:strand:+ start:343 stop:621 length:279 start_codon:yes stop_codon:yes gene_type:complete
MKNLTNPDKDPVEGDFVEQDIAGGGTIQFQWHDDVPYTAEESARLWRDLQLKESDWIAMLTDHPQNAAYKTYRTKLRDWPSTSDFPDTKPTL